MDIVLVGFITGFAYGGWRTGFLRRLLGIAFIVVAAIAGAYFRYPVGAIASTFFKDIPADYANLVGYTIAFPVILVGLHLAQSALMGKVGVQGITRGVDGALGALFGFVEGILILSVLVIVVDTYFGTRSALPPELPTGLLTEFTKAFNGSETVKILQGTTVPVLLAILGPLLPKDLSAIFADGLPTRLPFPIQPQVSRRSVQAVPRARCTIANFLRHQNVRHSATSGTIGGSDLDSFGFQWAGIFDNWFHWTVTTPGNCTG